MKLSIVIPYFNRRTLILNVLRSFNRSYPLEIIVVDDGSSDEHQIDDLIEEYDLTLIKLPKSEWKGPTQAYNIGFSQVTGDVILINSSECVHVGDVIGYVYENFKPKDYIAFSACMGEPGIEYDYSEDFVAKAQKRGAWWGVHSSIGNSIPYCAAISKEDMDTLGGYDSRFIHGVGFDDYDFVHRIKNLGLKISIIDKPCCFHQWHKPTVYPNYRNLDLLKHLNEVEPNRIKAQ